MDDQRFDNLTRTLATGISRRVAVKGSLSVLLGVFGARRHADAQVTQVACGNQFCASNPGNCKAGCVCCIYTNSVGQVTNSRCRPPGTCAPGSVAGSTTTPAPTTNNRTANHDACSDDHHHDGRAANHHNHNDRHTRLPTRIDELQRRLLRKSLPMPPAP